MNLRHAILLFLCCIGLTATAAPRRILVFVALCDNQHQGIIPVPQALGNGQDPKSNLYWGAQYGLRTYFDAAPTWTQTHTETPKNGPVLERTVYRHATEDVVLIASAYDGREIKTATTDFLRAANGNANLIVYIGHNGLMDFALPDSRPATAPGPDAMVLACSSNASFAPHLRALASRPVTLTTGFMAPEAYTLAAALDGWIADESSDALATGMSLYALGQTGPSSSPEITKAREFLRGSQLESGRWDVPGTKTSAKGNSTPTSTYWGTAWAVVGLLSTR